MANPKTFVPGSVFFHVNYYDKDLLIPHIQTLVFESRDSDEFGDFWIFREPGEERSVDHGESIRIAFKESELWQLLDYSALARVIGELQKVIEAALADAPKTMFSANLALIERHIHEWELQQRRSLHISARYMDEGVFVQRNEGRWEISAFTHPLRDPEMNQRMSLLLSKWNLHPGKDYLADRGRTRVLSAALPADVGTIAKICAEVFTVVYESNADTELVFEISD